MRYTIIGRRGVLKECAPFLLDEGNPLSFDFENLPNGYVLALKRDRTVEKEIVVKAQNHVEIDAYRLKAGTYNVELKKVDGGFITDKIICTPISVTALSAMNHGLICYPETDTIINRVAELERMVDNLLAWKDEVAPKIHEHKIHR